MGAAILASGKRLGTPSTRSFVGLGFGLDCSKEISHPTGVRNPGRSARSESLRRIGFPATRNVIYIPKLYKHVSLQLQKKLNCEDLNVLYKPRTLY
jgi:hypothetical protein